MVGAAFVLLIAYLFVAQWVRVTVFTVAALVWLNIVNIAGPAVSLLPATSTASAGGANTPATPTPAAGDAAPADSLPPTSANLTAYLNQFYEREKAAPPRSRPPCPPTPSRSICW